MIDDPAVFVMKVSAHASEEWDAIVERKRRELNTAGVALWGYGGSACHPTRQVQPFARSYAGQVTVAMLLTSSRKIETVTSMSSVGENWQPIPDGVTTGAKWALVLSDLSLQDEEIDLAAYEVAIGPSQNKAATAYLQGQSGKACLRRAAADHNDVRPVAAVGRLMSPWAVFLRGRRVGPYAPS